MAPGGMIRQQIHDDPYGIAEWDTSISARCFIHLANSQAWAAITGEAPPPTPITKDQYENCGIPWFDYYFSDDHALKGSSKLAALDSVSVTTIKKGASPGELSAPITVREPIDLSPRRQVREGSF